MSLAIFSITSVRVFRVAEFIMRGELGGKVDGIRPLTLNMHMEKYADGPTSVVNPTFIKRFYPMKNNNHNKYLIMVPNFEKLRDDFYLNLGNL